MKFATIALMLSAASATHDEMEMETSSDWDVSTPAQAYNPCDCLGYDGLPTYFFEQEGYGSYYGTSCSAWDAEESYCQEDGEYAGADWCAPGFDWCYVDAECEDSEPTEVFAETEWDGWLEWRNCEGDFATVRDGAKNLVAAVATAFTVASFAM